MERRAVVATAFEITLARLDAVQHGFGWNTHVFSLVEPLRSLQSDAASAGG
ncbi:hypothetical protein D3C71_2017870 [compost metagenome]